MLSSLPSCFIYKFLIGSHGSPPHPQLMLAYPGCHTQDTVPRTPYPGPRAQDAVPRTPCPGCHTQDLVPRTLYPGHHTQDAMPRMRGKMLVSLFSSPASLPQPRGFSMSSVDQQLPTFISSSFFSNELKSFISTFFTEFPHVDIK